MSPLTLTTHAAIDQIPAGVWDALTDGNPFTTHRFLAALESSGSVGPGTGWQALHITLEQDGQIVGAAPVYAKGHSQGEYIFDHAWGRLMRGRGAIITRNCNARCRLRPPPGRGSWRGMTIRGRLCWRG